MMSNPAFPLQIFYDGSCSVCSREVEQYGRRDRHGLLILIDISDPAFDPAPFNISREQFMYELHVIDRNGAIYRGIDAFRAIWLAFPSSKLLRLCVTLITLPLINPLARLCYRAFARIRRYLPKRYDSCKSGSCRIGKI